MYLYTCLRRPVFSLERYLEAHPGAEINHVNKEGTRDLGLSSSLGRSTRDIAKPVLFKAR